MCSVTVWKELFVHTVSTDAVYLIGRIFLNFLQKFLDRMNDDSIFYLVIFISGPFFLPAALLLLFFPG